jgi:hypothetical protein
VVLPPIKKSAKALFFCLLYFDELWFIKSETLKQLINTNDFPRFLNAGDIGSETHGYLIKRKDYKKYFHVCKI